jgi:ribosome-interacting GTPase 1
VVTSKDDSGKVHPVSIIKNRGAKSTLDLRTVLNKKTGKPTFVRGLISMFPEDVHDDLMIYISNKFLYGKNLNHLETFSIDVVELEKIFKMHNRRKEYENRKVIFRSGSRFIDIDYKFLDDFIDTFESGRLSTTEVKFSDSDLN